MKIIIVVQFFTTVIQNILNVLQMWASFVCSLALVVYCFHIEASYMRMHLSLLL